MKTARITINGTEYTLCLTLKSAKAIESKCGSLSKVLDIMRGQSIVETYENTLWILSQLLIGGRDYAAFCESREENPPDLEQLGVVCGIGSIGTYQAKILEAISAGMTREVETEIDPKKESAMQK